MFGRVRASSLELLEMERPHPKITKHDSLSIYEFTLLKLKQGSHCNPSCDSDDYAKTDAYRTIATDSPEEAMTADADCSSTDDTSRNSSPIFQTKEQGSKNMSILCFFSKCKSSQHAQNSNDRGDDN